MFLRQRLVFLFLAVLLLLPFLDGGQNSYRDRELQPEKLMDAIGVLPGMIIGEGGAGRGYFTFKLAARVGPDGKIYANDIDRSALSAIRSRCEREGVANIQTILGEVEDPLFPPGLDMVFMVAAFHDFEKQVEWLENVKSSLKPEATLVIVEKDPDRYGRDRSHHMTKEEILATVKKADFELVRVDMFLV
jgi:ubiquinone/menaquinone biosynthesis C-methylase UbiE